MRVLAPGACGFPLVGEAHRRRHGLLLKEADLRGEIRAVLQCTLPGVNCGRDTEWHRISDELKWRFWAKRLEAVLLYANTTREDGEQKVAAISAALVRYLTLEWAAVLDGAVECRLTHSDFTVLYEDNSVPVGSVDLVGLAPTVVKEAVLKPEQVTEALRDFEVKTIAPPPVFAADLVTAREMFLAGLQAPDPVVRFLIIYSALSVFASFRWGFGEQHDVDALIRIADPTVAELPRQRKTRRPRKAPANPTTTETIYTNVRNTFVHAADRGKDPVSAADAIRKLVRDFQTVAARALR